MFHLKTTDSLKNVREQEEREQKYKLALARLIIAQSSMSSTPNIINLKHPGYVNQPNHHYSSHTNGAFGMSTQVPSHGSFLHELNDFKDLLVKI